MDTFILIFITTNFTYSLAIYITLYPFNNGRYISNSRLILCSIALGAPTTTTLLFNLITLFPNRSDEFYLSSINYFYLALIFFSTTRIFRRRYYKLNNKTHANHLRSAYIIFILLLFSFPYLRQYTYNYVTNPLEGHDALVYGVEGKIYYRDKTFKSKYLGFDEKTGFSYYSLHSPIFPLFLTWEKIFGNKLGYNKDYFFKIISPFYGILILCLVYNVLGRNNPSLGILGICGLFSSTVFFGKYFTYHIDMFRIYFFTASIVLLALSIETKDLFVIILYAIHLGFSSSAHSIGMILSIISTFIFFLFLEESLTIRIKYFTMIYCIIFILGGFYYLNDSLWGKGWIFS